MKKIYALLTAFVLTIAATGQTLNVKVGNVTYQFPATQAGEMNYSNGKTLTIMGKLFTLTDIEAITADDTSVKDNTVAVAYNGTTATVTIAGNVAQYVDATVSGAHVAINQTNTADIDDDEITYTISGTSEDGSFALDGSYKCSIQLAGVTLTNPNGSAININNKKRIQISAKKDTDNTLADGAAGSQKACIYSKGQLQLQGNGRLDVVGNAAHAIKSGDYISVKNLTLNIASAAKDGISCNKYFQMKSGNVTIQGVGDDGIQVELEADDETTAETEGHEDENSGNIYIEDGTLVITVPATAAGGKCLKAREQIAERIRDKVSATRRQGKFVGGTPPFGYRAENRKLVIQEDDAKILRRIFDRYLEIQSPKQIAAELNADGIRTRRGMPWTTSHIYRQLNSRACIGEVEYKGEVFQGEHEAIIDRARWDEAQRLLAQNSPVEKGAKKERESIKAPLKGLLKCGHCGCSMLPHYARKKDGRRYYYYICMRETKRSEHVCPVHRVPGGDMERLVMDELGAMFKSPSFRHLLTDREGLDADEVARQLADTSKFWDGLYPAERQRLMRLLVEKAVVFKDSLEIEIKTSGMKKLYEEMANGEVCSAE